MNRKQKLTWLMNALILIGAAAATSWIDHAGARTLTRLAVLMMCLIAVAEFWQSVPTISRTQARINRVQRRYARRRGMNSGGVKA